MQDKKKLSDIAYFKLKEMILNNKFKSGEHLEEIALCEMLGISRTPLREGINRLVNDQLLVSVPQKGIFVPEMSMQNISELFQARKMIEPMVIMLSAKYLDKNTLMDFRQKTLELLDIQDIDSLHRLDYRFHSYISENCHNQYLFQTASFLTDRFQRVRTQDFYPIERSINGAKEHLTIIDELIKGNFDEVPKLVLDHITSTEVYYYRKLLDNDTATKAIYFLKNSRI